MHNVVKIHAEDADFSRPAKRKLALPEESDELYCQFACSSPTNCDSGVESSMKDEKMKVIFDRMLTNQHMPTLHIAANVVGPIDRQKTACRGVNLVCTPRPKFKRPKRHIPLQKESCVQISCTPRPKSMVLASLENWRPSSEDSSFDYRPLTIIPVWRSSPRTTTSNGEINFVS